MPFGTASALVCELDKPHETVQVEHVIDGDTVRLVDGRRVRFSAINTPELARNRLPEEPFAREAKKRIEDLIFPTNTLLLRYENNKKDRYGRVLAHVFNQNGTNLQAELLRQGLAAHSIEPPNLWQNDCYKNIEQTARISHKGIWSSQRFGTIMAGNLSKGTNGFYRISGTVQAIETTDQQTLMTLTSRVYLRIAKSDMKYFRNMSVNQLRGQRVTAQGWAFSDKVNTYLRIRHPSALNVAE